MPINLNHATAGTVTLKSPASGTPTFTLPAADGTSGQTWTTNGSGVLSFGTLGVAGGGTGSSTTFTSGSVVFAGASGVYTQDNANFFWDDTNNRLGIGTTGPAQALHVVGAATATTGLFIGTTTNPGGAGTDYRFAFDQTVADYMGLFRNSNATTPYGFQVRYSAATPNNTGQFFMDAADATATRFQLRSNGGIANFQANNVNLSDLRVKTDIKPAPSYWDKVKALEVVTFKYKDQTHDDDNIGFIAQQVEAVEPVWVDNDGIGKTPEDGMPLKTIYMADLQNAAIKALQEAMARIEALEKEIAALKS